MNYLQIEYLKRLPLALAKPSLSVPYHSFIARVFSLNLQYYYIDFGAIRETMGTVVNSQGNPTSSIVIGTPGYMPSEQAPGRPLYSSNLYSLGVTAMYMKKYKLAVGCVMPYRCGSNT